MKSKANIIIHKNNQIELLVNGKKIDNVIAISDVRNLHTDDTMKEIDITLCVSDVEIFNMITGIVNEYPKQEQEKEVSNICRNWKNCSLDPTSCGRSIETTSFLEASYNIRTFIPGLECKG